MLSTQIGNELAAAKIDLRDAILGEKGAMIDQREAAGRCAFDEVRALHTKASAARDAAAAARVRIADAKQRLAVAKAAEAAAQG